MGTLMAGQPIHTSLPRHGWVADCLIESNSWSSSSPLLDLSVVLPRFHYTQVPHVRQLYSWDCGLACCLMVLQALGVSSCDLKSLAKLCSTTSVWTIDLAHLLRRFAVNVSLITVTIGANPRFAVESFYQDHMEEDGDRVNRLFEQAPLVGIQIQGCLVCPHSASRRFIFLRSGEKGLACRQVAPVTCKWRSISGDEICMLMLSGRYLAIALVDKRRLNHPWLDVLCLGDCCGSNTGYTGHYVVICGYDLETDEFEIRDPASSSGSGRISLNALEAARKSFGTDEDILFVSLDSFDPEPTALAMVASRSSGDST